MATTILDILREAYDLTENYANDGKIYAARLKLSLAIELFSKVYEAATDVEDLLNKHGRFDKIPTNNNTNN